MDNQADASKYVLEVKDLVVKYETDKGTVHAVNGVDLKLERGKTLALVGETGAGKTTTALSLLRLVPDPPGKISNGTVILDGDDIFSLSKRQMERIRGGKVSMVFQDPMTSLNPVHTVGAQIAEVIRIHQGGSKADAHKKAVEMLELVGIGGERSEEYPHQFSGGMKQRVVIAIALACNPSLLIADEPTTALDVTIQAQVLELMKELKTKYNTSMILITHDLGIVAETSDEVSIMYAGRVLEHGTLQDVFKNTKHPYTVGLFNSLPNLKSHDEALKPIKGRMPDPMNLPLGCSFYPRCEYAQEICSTRKPVKSMISDTHFVECLGYEEGTNVSIFTEKKEV